MRPRSGDRLLFSAAAVDLTPRPGLPMGGYIARGDALARGTLDPLEATIVRIRESRTGGVGVTWVAIDALAVDEAHARAIADAVARASGVSPESVIVCASHTHSGPAGWVSGLPFASPKPGDPSLRAEMIRRIADGAERLADQVPVSAVLVDGEVEGIGTNRFDPAGPTDRSVGALCLINDEDVVRGVVVDHASHPTVLGHENLRWSADWPGAARRSLATAIASTRGQADPPIVAFLQGAAGDTSSRFVRHSQTPAEVDRLGARFAERVSPLVFGADRRDANLPAITLRRRRVSVPTRRLGAADLVREVASAEAAWRAIASEEVAGAPAERIARTRHEGALTAASLAGAGLPAAVDLPIALVVIGAHAWLHVPVELFASWAQYIRAASPFDRTRIIGYADGYAGYVADAEAYQLGGYEAASSLFDADGARLLVDASVEFLQRTFDDLTVSRRAHA